MVLTESVQYVQPGNWQVLIQSFTVTPLYPNGKNYRLIFFQIPTSKLFLSLAETETRLNQAKKSNQVQIRFVYWISCITSEINNTLFLITCRYIHWRHYTKPLQYTHKLQTKTSSYGIYVCKKYICTSMMCCWYSVIAPLILNWSSRSLPSKEILPVNLSRAFPRFFLSAADIILDYTMQVRWKYPRAWARW